MPWPWRSSTSAPTRAAPSRSGTRAGSSCSPAASGGCPAAATPPADQGRGLRLRPRRQGPGGPDGRRAAGAARAAGLRPRGRRARRRHLRPQPRARGAGGHRMIALVRGDVAVRRPDHVVVECGGVGYRLAVSAETLRWAYRNSPRPARPRTAPDDLRRRAFP